MVVKDLTLKEAKVEGKDSIGTLCGKVESSAFRNIKLFSSIIKSNADYSGGMIGIADNCTFDNIDYEGNVEGSSNNTGGIIGLAKNTIVTNCTVVGDVTGKNFVGGVVGQGYNVSFTNANVTGNIKNGDYIGGILGFACGKCMLKNAYYIGEISGSQRLGGIIGYVNAEGDISIDTCMVKGTIKGSSDNIGGLVGLSEGGSINRIEHSSFVGKIFGVSYVGGLIGSMIHRAVDNVQTYSYDLIHPCNTEYNEHNYLSDKINTLLILT